MGLPYCANVPVRSEVPKKVNPNPKWLNSNEEPSPKCSVLSAQCGVLVRKASSRLAGPSGLDEDAVLFSEVARGGCHD